MSKKITIIGGGSSMFTPHLLRLVMCSSLLGDSTVCLMDIDEQRLQVMAHLGRQLAEKEGIPLTIEASTDQRTALVGADYVIVAISVGGMDAWENDIEIPGRYGIFTEVHDSIGPGGIMRAFRHAPILASICQDLAEVSPQAWVFNYTNPASANTIAMQTVPSINSVSLCSCTALPMNAYWLAAIAGVPPDALAMPPLVAGINHCAGIVDLRLKDGKSLIPVLRQRTQADVTASIEQIFHTVADVPAMRARMQDLSSPDELLQLFVYTTGFDEAVVPWALNTYGILPYCWTHWIEFFPPLLRLTEPYNGRAQGLRMKYGTRIFDMREKRARVKKWQDLAERWSKPEYMNEVSLKNLPRGEEDEGIEVIDIIEAMIENRNAIHIVNVANHGAIDNLPADTIVEVNAVVGSYGIRPLYIGPLPEALAAHLRLHATVQQLTVEAALTGDRHIALQAFQLDPATAAVLEPPQIARMLDEMLQANAQYLPRFA